MGDLKYRVYIEDFLEVSGRPEPKGRHFFGSFATAEEAVETCKCVIDRSLLHVLRAHRVFSAESFFDCFMSSGASPWIRAAEGAALPDFSVRRYAAAQIESLWSEMAREQAEVL